MAGYDPARAVWHKSARSGQNGNCVEVAGIGDVVALRDSKDVDGPMFVLAARQWAMLVNDVKRGCFDL